MSKDEISIHILRKLVVDGLLIFGLVLCLVATEKLWEPFHRGFFCGDETLMFPYHGDTVTVPMLRIFGLGLPLLAFLICEWTLLRTQRSDERCLGVRIPAWVRGFYCAGVSFALGLCFTELLTNIAKNVIGRPRPHFFDVCQPSIDCESAAWRGRYIQASDYHCTGEDSSLFPDMRKSFLSGHSAWSAYTMAYLALYLEKRMVWRGTRVLRHVLQFGAIVLSWFTALSRVSDFKHHWSDVLAGYALGTTMAVIVWSCLGNGSSTEEENPRASVPSRVCHIYQPSCQSYVGVVPSFMRLMIARPHLMRLPVCIRGGLPYLRIFPEISGF